MTATPVCTRQWRSGPIIYKNIYQGFLMSIEDPYHHIRLFAASLAERTEPADDTEPLDTPAERAQPSPNFAARRPVAKTPTVEQLGAKLGAIAAELKAARRARGLTQHDLGRLAGVPQSHISKIESGAVDLRLSSLLALAQILGLSVRVEAEPDVPGQVAIQTPPGLADTDNLDYAGERLPAGTDANLDTTAAIAKAPMAAARHGAEEPRSSNG